jgi:hypothetical protein
LFGAGYETVEQVAHANVDNIRHVLSSLTPFVANNSSSENPEHVIYKNAMSIVASAQHLLQTESVVLMRQQHFRM